MSDVISTEAATVEQVEYRDIEGFPGYRVGSDGSVWSCRRFGAQGGLCDQWRQMAKNFGCNRRIHVQLYRDTIRHGFLVHALVLTAFVGPRPDGMECCHNNGDAFDNRVNNLRWDTPKSNQADRLIHGTACIGEDNPGHKLKSSQVVEIKRLLRDGVRPKVIGEMFGVHRATIEFIRNGATWSHIAIPT